jgi:predicted ATP-grasp superfamily ATP-dependent carboligase
MSVMANASSNILVLDANQRSALAVTRSLGRSGEVRVFTADASVDSLAGHSKYSDKNFQCPSSETRPEEFLDWLESTLSVYHISAVFPVTEISSQLLLMNRDRLGNCHLPFADYDTLMRLADKGRLLEAARKAGIPVPDYTLFSSASEVDVDDFDSFPLVVKPCLSRIWTGEEWINTSVKIVASREDLIGVLGDTDYLQRAPFMIQSFIPGHGAGIFALYNRGTPVAYFSHRRLREKPPRGGVSVLSESVETDPQLKAYAEALLKSVCWHGVAMVEFRVGHDSTPYLMEVNTRFWGSLQLAIDSGVDFPYLLWQLSSGNAISVQGDYAVGQRLRWLLGDVDSLYLTWRDKHWATGDKVRRLIEFCTPRLSRCRHEVNRWNDFRPALLELRRYFEELAK